MAKKAKIPAAGAAGEQELLDQVRIAAEQIDADPGGRLGWLVRFVRDDPAAWLPSDRAGHGYRLLALGLPPLPPNIIRLGRDRVYPLQTQEVLDLHAELGTKFRALVNDPGRKVDVPTEGLMLTLVRASAPGAKPAIFGLSPGGPFRTMLWQKVAVLVSETDRLIACPICKQPFLALRKMMFCSPRCTQRHHYLMRVRAKKGGTK